MNVRLEVDSLQAILNDGKPSQSMAEFERGREFLRVLSMQMDATRAQIMKDKEKAEEARAAQEAKEKEKRIAELYALIAQFSQKLAASGYTDKTAAAQLSMAQTELFWLLSGL